MPDLEATARRYEKLGGMYQLRRICPNIVYGRVLSRISNTEVELLAPLDQNSSVARFLARNPSGGMHHLCFEVDDILGTRNRLRENGMQISGDREPKTGAHGKPMLFMHPRDFDSTLIELEEAITRPVSRHHVSASSPMI